MTHKSWDSIGIMIAILLIAVSAYFIIVCSIETYRNKEDYQYQMMLNQAKLKSNMNR